MSRIPIPITADEEAYLKRCQVDVVEGKIYNPKGIEIGSLNQGGRFQIRIPQGRNLRRHHVIWWKGTGEWPTFELDHRNRNRTDDRLENLEASTAGKNGQNVPKRKEEHEGLPVGVVRYPRSNGWAYIAQISTKGKCRWLGSFKSPEEAGDVYQKAWLEDHPNG
jgi:hypothetical protein